MKKILVTGGAGFIGSHLCRFLLARRHLVFCLDNLTTGSLENIQEFLVSPRFVFIKDDIVRPWRRRIKFDEIYNLACQASPKHYQRHPIETLMTCSLGVKNLLDLAVSQKAKFLQASTSEVYGDPTVHPQKESYFGNVNPIGPRSCYDEGKRFAESLVAGYARLYGLDGKIVRIFNTYGPSMAIEDGRVISTFIALALSGEPLTVYGRGQQTRSFCYVDDLVEGLFKMMKSRQRGPVNLGNPGEFRIIDLARIIRKMVGSGSTIVFEDLPQDDPRQRRPDITLAKVLLGWRPKVSLRQGLKLTLPHFAKASRGVVRGAPPYLVKNVRS